MTLFLLDTDTLIHAHAGHSNIAKHVQTVGELNVATTIISAVEIQARAQSGRAWSPDLRPRAEGCVGGAKSW